MLFREQREESAKVGLIEFLEWSELPEQGAEPVAQLCHASLEEILDRLAGFGEHPAIGGEARALNGEDKPVRRLARPFAEGLRLLRAIKGGVDFNRGEMARRIGKLLRLRQALWIEH